MKREIDKKVKWDRDCYHCKYEHNCPRYKDKTILNPSKDCDKFKFSALFKSI